MQNTKTAEALFLWNSQNLLAEARLEKNTLAEFFVTVFQINVNGRNYVANRK